MCLPKRHAERREHNKNSIISIFSVSKSAEGVENPTASPWGKALAGWGFHSAAVPIPSKGMVGEGETEVNQEECLMPVHLNLTFHLLQCCVMASAASEQMKTN